MSSTIPTVSLTDSVKFNLSHVVPYLLKGIFTRNERWVTFWEKLQADPLGVKLIDGLRKKYGSDYLYLYLLRDKSLLVLDPEGIRHVLDNSPTLYAETKAKRERMSHFQPNALTLSRGEEWTDRRAFNTAVLHCEHGMHQYADAFLEIIREEVANAKTTDAQTWSYFDSLFDRITLQILFGKGQVDTDLTAALKAMMLESNEITFSGKKSKHFDAYYRKIAEHLQNPAEKSLAFLCKQTPSTEVTRVENQIPHWMFAMKDTLASNSVCALALIVAHTEAEKRIRDELAGVDAGSAQGINGLKYLEACIHEAMRLWPSTLMLTREAVAEDTIGDKVIPAKTQVIIHNGFNHRDAKALLSADTFYPDQWLTSDRNPYRFNHFSNGPQACAGKHLALFIAKAILAALLATYRYRLTTPPIDPGQPIPYAYNHFKIELECSPWG